MVSSFGSACFRVGRLSINLLKDFVSSLGSMTTQHGRASFVVGRLSTNLLKDFVLALKVE